MAEAKRNTIVGLFALVGLVVMCVLVFIFGGGKSLLSNTYDIRVHFPKGVVGVAEGQGVTLNGKRIGETKAVEFHDPAELSTGVDVIVAVENKYDIPKDSAILVAASIMGFGRPAIRLVIHDQPGPEKLPHDGKGIIRGQMVEMLDQMLPPEIQNTLTTSAGRIGDLAASLKPVTEELKRMMEQRGVQDVDAQKLTANLDTVIQRLDASLKNFNTIVGDPENQQNLKAMLAAGRKTMENGATLVEKGTTMMDQGTALVGDLRAAAADGRTLFAQAGRTLQNLTEATDQLTVLLRRTDQAVALLTEGQGTAGLLLKDNRLYEEMVLTVRRMTKALDDFRDVMDLAKKGELKIKAF